MPVCSSKCLRFHFKLLFDGFVQVGLPDIRASTNLMSGLGVYQDLAQIVGLETPRFDVWEPSCGLVGRIYLDHDRYVSAARLIFHVLRNYGIPAEDSNGCCSF